NHDDDRQQRRGAVPGGFDGKWAASRLKRRARAGGRRLRLIIPHVLVEEAERRIPGLAEVAHGVAARREERGVSDAELAELGHEGLRLVDRDELVQRVGDEERGVALLD